MPTGPSEGRNSFRRAVLRNMAGVRGTADVGDDAVGLPRQRFAGTMAAHLEPLVGSRRLQGINDDTRPKLDIGVTAGGEGVGPDGQ